MFFALDDDQRAFGAAVRQYLAERFDLARVRGVVEDTTGDGCPAELWKAMGEQGWLAVLVPEQHDGLGLGLVEAQAIARELGAGVAPGPWAATVLAAEAIRLAGSEDQRAAWLPRFAAGEVAATVALRGTAGRYTADDPPFEVRSGRLHGRAAPVEYPGIAATIVTATRDGALYLLDPAVDGVSVTALDAYDGTTRLGAVELDGAAAEALTGRDASTFAELLDRGAVLTAAELTGLAREALTRTVAYDRDRQQFGKPVGSFQAIKHALADLHVGVTMAEHATLYAAHALDTADDGARVAVSVAKAKASEVALQVTAAMIQYHGGIGYTWEHEAHLFYKRAKRQAGAFGDVASHRERLAALTVSA